MFGPWCRWASSAAARMTGRFVPTKISSPSAMSRARKAAISSRTAASAAVTAPASVLIERQQAAQADLLEVVDVGLGPAYVAVEIGLERAAIAGTRHSAPGLDDLVDVRAVLELEARARERMGAERRAHDAVGEERGALGRAADLLVRHDALHLHERASGGPPQEAIGVAGADELHVAVYVGGGRVHERDVGLDGGHREQRLAEHRVGEDLEVRVHLGIGGPHAAPA